MHGLSLCSTCSRHVRASATVCPFCDGVLSARDVPAEDEPSAAPVTRSDLVGRGRRFTRAALAASALFGACNAAYGAPPHDAGGRADGGAPTDAADAPGETDAP